MTEDRNSVDMYPMRDLLLEQESEDFRALPDPVSYTHLDVYKRQLLTSVFLSSAVFPNLGEAKSMSENNPPKSSSIRISVTPSSSR